MKGNTVDLGRLRAGLLAAELPPGQVERRGRRFVAFYATLVLLATGAFVALLLLVHARDQGLLTAVDLPVARALQRLHGPLAGWVLTHTSDLGYVPLNVVAYAAVGALLAALRLRLEAAVGLGSSLLAGAVGSALKQALRRARPSGGLIHVAAHLHDYSFPSGHVLQYTTLFGFTFFVVWVAWRRGAVRTLALAVLALLVALVGPSRIYLGEHWPSDVAAAYCLGGLWLAGTIEGLLALKRRLPPRLGGRPHRRSWTAL